MRDDSASVAERGFVLTNYEGDNLRVTEEGYTLYFSKEQNNESKRQSKSVEDRTET